jgi:hypothetical protein
MLRAFRLLPLLPLASVACLKAPGDTAPDLGASVGSYHVVGTSVSNTCGEGALGSTAAWEFDVSISQDDAGHVFWNDGRAVMAGQLGADGSSFTFSGGAVVDMRPPAAPIEDQGGTGPGLPDPSEGSSGAPAPPLPPCSLSRSDTSSGTLAVDRTALSGTLTYGFSPTTGSDCTDLVYGTTAAFATLPCAMSFSMSGTATTP